MPNIEFKRAGKAIGGGKLTLVKRDGKTIGMIIETLDLFMAHTDVAQPGRFTVAHSMDEAQALFTEKK